MGRGIRIGQIFGINIRVEWSWLFIFLLVTWNLSSAFGRFHPNWGVVARWGLGVAAALLFFGSVLAHELAHSLVARARGIPVQSITLFLFGGVSNIRQEPDSPQAEFLMAVVGPLTSLILGAVLVWAASTGAGSPASMVGNPTEALSRLGPVATLLLWLGSINFTLGVFNLIPGFPLDGGRILRSILWGITDNLRRATRWASWAGQGIAWLMIIGGVAMAFGVQIPFFGTGLASGLWLAFIGWFLNSAAVQSYQRLVVQDMLEGVPLTRLMRSCPPIVSSQLSVSQLVHDYVMQSDEFGFPVVDEGKLVGIVSLDDVRNVERHRWDDTLVREIMTPEDQLVTASPQEDAAEVLSKLMERDVRQLPVLENGELTGCVRRRDIMKWLQLEAESI